MTILLREHRRMPHGGPPDDNHNWWWNAELMRWEYDTDEECSCDDADAAGYPGSSSCPACQLAGLPDPYEYEED